MSADNVYSDDWNSCLTGSQMNAWNLEDDISRIGSKAEDFLSGIWGAESCVSEKNSKWKAHSEPSFSDPFRRFQTPPSSRTSPTPLADLYSQSIYQAEVDSDSWQAPESCSDDMEQTDEESFSPGLKNVDCMPLDMFSFSQPGLPQTGESSLETLNRSLTEPQDYLAAEDTASFTGEESGGAYTPRLIVDSTKGESARSPKRPLLSLSIGMSICGVGLVFGAQIMHNAAVINPGKSLIIAGLIGLAVSVVLQSVSLFSRRKAV